MCAAASYFGIKPLSRTVDIAKSIWKSGCCCSDIRNNALKQLTPYGRYPISRATRATMATMAMARAGFHDTNFVAPKAQQWHRPHQKNGSNWGICLDDVCTTDPETTTFQAIGKHQVENPLPVELIHSGWCWLHLASNWLPHVPSCSATLGTWRQKPKLCEARKRDRIHGMDRNGT